MHHTLYINLVYPKFFHKIWSTLDPEVCACSADIFTDQHLSSSMDCSWPLTCLC